MMSARPDPGPSALALSPGQRIDKYELTGLWPESSCYGVLYRAYNAFLDSAVCLRVVALVGEPESLARQRMQREVQLLCRLRHPSLLSVLDAGALYERHAYLVTEPFQGQSLRELLKTRRSLEPSEVVELGIAISEGLTLAHAQGLIHGDLRPETIRSGPGTVTQVTDLGIARWYQESTLLTDRDMARSALSYMAPELLEGEPSSARTDIFALGALLVELLLGRTALLFENPDLTLDALVERQRKGEHLSLLRVLPAIAPALDTVLGRLAAKEPARRFQTMAEVHHALLACRELFSLDAPQVRAFDGESPILVTTVESVPPSFVTTVESVPPSFVTTVESVPPSFVTTDLLTQRDSISSFSEPAPEPRTTELDGLPTRTATDLELAVPRRSPEPPSKPPQGRTPWGRLTLFGGAASLGLLVGAWWTLHQRVTPPSTAALLAAPPKPVPSPTPKALPAVDQTAAAKAPVLATQPAAAKAPVLATQPAAAKAPVLAEHPRPSPLPRTASARVAAKNKRPPPKSHAAQRLMLTTELPEPWADSSSPKQKLARRGPPIH